jgi:hypothetical protein
MGFLHEKSSLYYPQENGKIEAINKVLKTMIQQMVGEQKSNWHLKIFSTLWTYRNSIKTVHWVYTIPIGLWPRGSPTY